MCISSIWSWRCYGLYGLIFNALAKNFFRIRIPLGSIFLPQNTDTGVSRKIIFIQARFTSDLCFLNFDHVPKKLAVPCFCPSHLEDDKLLSSCWQSAFFWFRFTEILLHYLEHKIFTKEMSPAVGLWLCVWLCIKARKSSVQVKMGIWRNWSLFWIF